MLELWYFTWTFLVRRPFRGYHYVLPCDHNLGVWPFFKNFNLANTFWAVSALALLYDMSISSDNTGILVTMAIFGIGQYREHFCFTNKSCLVCSPLDYYFLNIYFKYCSMNDLWSLLSYNEFHAFIYISIKNVLKQWLLSYKKHLHDRFDFRRDFYSSRVDRRADQYNVILRYFWHNRYYIHKSPKREFTDHWFSQWVCKFVVFLGIAAIRI